MSTKLSSSNTGSSKQVKMRTSTKIPRVTLNRSKEVLSGELSCTQLQGGISSYFKKLIENAPAWTDPEQSEYFLKKGLNDGVVFPWGIPVARTNVWRAPNAKSGRSEFQTTIQDIQKTLTELSADPAGVVFAKNLELPSTVSTKQEALELCMRAKHIFSSTLFQDVLLFEHDLKSEDAREGVEFLYNLLHSEKPVHSTPAIHVLGAVKKVKTLSKYFEWTASYEVLKRVDKELRDEITFLYSLGVLLHSDGENNFTGLKTDTLATDLIEIRNNLDKIIRGIENWPEDALIDTNNQENVEFWKIVHKELTYLFDHCNPNTPWDVLNDLIVQVSKNISLAGALDEGNTATVLLKLAEVADLPDVFEFSFGQISKNVRYRELVAILLICHLMEAGIDLAPDDMSRDDAEKILRLLDLMPSFSYNSYLAWFLEGKISVWRFATRMRANGELSVDNYFEIRALALDDPEKLSVMDNLQLSFLFQELKKDANTKNYYVVFEGRRIPVVGKSEALNRKAIAAIGDKKSVPGHAKWWSAQYVHHPEPKFILTWVGVIEASTYTQRSGSERFTPLDPLEAEIFTAMQKPNDWYNYVLDDCITVHDHINFHRQKHSFDELKKAVGGLLESPQEERVQRAEVIKKMIQNSVDSAFYRKYIHHILRQTMDIKDDVLMSLAPQVPMTVKSRLFATEPLETERRLLGKVGFGRMTVDELLASLSQPAEETPAPAETIETVDYEQYVRTQGLKYVPTDVDVVPGTTRTPMGGEYHEYDFVGYGSYPKLRTLLEMNFDSSAIRIHATQNGYHIVHINSNINKTVIISDEQGKATYIFNGLVPVPKKGEMILSDINPELYPQIGGRIYFAGVEQVDEWKDRILERLTDPEWAIKEMKRIERLDDNMTRKCVAEMAKAGIFEFVLNNQDLGKNVSKSRNANRGGRNVDWEVFLETWNLFIEHHTEQEVWEAWKKRWENDATRFPLFERYVLQVATNWQSFVELHPEFSTHRLPPFNRFFQMLGGLPSLNSYKSHSKRLPEYSATMLMGTIGDHVAHVLVHMNEQIRHAAIENASMGVSIFLDRLLCGELPRPIASDFENTPSWKTKYEARNNLPDDPIPHGLGNTTSLVIYLGGRTNEVDPSDFNAVAAFVNARIDGHEVK